MKKLLSILSSISLSTLGVVNVISCVDLKRVPNQLRVHDDVVWIYNEMNYLINSDEVDVETYLIVYRQVPKTIYKINTEENLYKFMFVVDQFQNKLQTLSADVQQSSEINGIKVAIEDAVKFWESNTDVNELAGSFIELASRERAAAGKLYYAFNQMSSKQLVDDIETFQPYRIREIELQTAISNTLKQNDLINQYLEEYSRMEEWQERVAKIFDNWIEEAERLQAKFMGTWNSYFSSPQAFFEKMVNKAEDFVKGTIREYINRFKNEVGSEVSSWLTDEVVKNYEDQVIKNIQKSGPEDQLEGFPKWIQNINSEGPTLPSDPNEKPAEVSNEEWKDAVIKEVDLETGDKITTKLELEKKIEVATKYLKQAYAIDSYIFGEIHDSAKEFKEFAQGSVSRLSEDVSSAFKAAGVDYTDETDKKILEVVSIVNALCDAVIDVFLPDSMLGKIKELSFATLEKIIEWYNDFDVFKNSDKVIETIEIAKQDATKVPVDKIEDYEKYKEEQVENIALLETYNQELLEISKKLEESQFDKIQNNLVDFNGFFSKYENFLDIDIYKIESLISIQLNPERYWNEQLKAYNDIATRRQGVFEKLAAINNIEEILNDKWKEISADDVKLEEINQFIVRGWS